MTLAKKNIYPDRSWWRQGTMSGTMYSWSWSAAGDRAALTQFTAKPPDSTALLRPRMLDCMELEDRVLFSAAPMAMAVAPQGATAGTGHVHPLGPHSSAANPCSAQVHPLGPLSSPAHRLDPSPRAAGQSGLPSQPGTRVVLIDSQLADASQLEEAVAPDSKLFIYDSKHDTAAEVLQSVVHWAETNGKRIDDLAVLSHGVGGAFELGNQWITATSLPQTAAAWQGLGRVLSAGANIELFGCNVAAPGSDGRNLLNSLAAVTHAAVFASTDSTGAGGDWQLEAASAGASPAALGASSVPLNTALLAGYGGVLGTIAIDNTSSAATTSGGASSLTFSHTVNSGSDSILIVEVADSHGGASDPVASVTYGSQGLTLLGSATLPNAESADIWYLLAPAVGTANVVVTLTGSCHFVASATDYFGVNQTNPLGTLVTATGSASSTPSVTVASAAGQLVIDSLIVQGDVAPIAPTGPGQTLLWSQTTGTSAGDALGGGSDQNGASTVTMSWSENSAHNWALAAVPLIAAPVNQPPTVATPASATPSPVAGPTTALSVLGADDGGEANLSYTWAAAGTPPAPVTFSVNGTNGSKNTIATFAAAGNYNFQVTITDAGGLSTTSNVSVTVVKTLSSIAIQPGPAAMADNTTYPISATGLDQFGNPLASQPAFTWSVDGGGAGGTVNTAGLYSTPASNTGTDTIRATSGSISGTVSVAVTGDGIFSGGYDVGPPNLPGSFSYNAGTYTVTGGYQNTTTDGFQFANATFTGNATLVAQVTNLDGTATPAAAGVIFRDTTGSLSAYAGVVLGPGNQATFYDRTSTGGPSQATTVSGVQAQWVKIVRNGNTFSGYYSVDGATWTQVGSSVTYPDPGTILGGLVVSSLNASTLSTATFTNVASAVPAIATPAAASPNPVSGTSTGVSVLGAYAGGGSSLTYTWSGTGTPPAPVIFADNGDNNAKDTTATFTKAGVYNLLVTVSNGTQSATSSVAVTVAQTLSSTTVSPAAAALNENGTQQFTATAYDQFGNALTTQPSFTWSLASGVGSVNASGLYTAPGGTGSASIEAGYPLAGGGAVSGTGAVTVSNAAPTVATPASATPSPVTGTSTALSVLGADDGGQANLTYTWAATGTPPAPVSFSINGSNAAQNTTATFSQAGKYSFQVTITDAGGLSTTSTVNVTVNQTLANIAVTPGTAALNENGTQQFTATAYDQFGNALTGAPGTPGRPSFTWSLVSGVGSVNASGLYAAPGGTGSASIEAGYPLAGGGAVSGTGTVTVSNAAPTVATPAAATPSPVTGTTTALSVLGADDGGQANLTYTWAATGTPPAPVSFSINGSNAAQNTTATFPQAGKYSFQVTITDAGGLSTTSTVNVTVNQTLANIAVTPGTAALNENGTQQFTATAYDQFGNALTGAPGTPGRPSFTWSLVSGGGSVNATGLYTAPGGTGSANIEAGYPLAGGGAFSGTGSVTVTNAAPTVAAPASATPSPVTGTSTALSVLGADDGGRANIAYTWATTGTPPAPVSFSANGSNASQNTTATFTKAGNYSFQVTITDAGGLSTTSSVNVTVAQTLTAITVNPATAALNENATQQFTATAYDQFGNALTGAPGNPGQPAFAWSLAGGIGSVDASGLYTARGNSGAAHVTATSGAVSGTGSVTVIPPPLVAVPAPQDAQPSGIVFSTATGNAISISDPAVGNRTIQVTLAATNGAITLAGTQGLTLGSGKGQQDSQIVMTGTVSDVNAALNGMLFRATVQSAQLEIAANDLGHSGAGGPQTGSATVVITQVLMPPPPSPPAVNPSVPGPAPIVPAQPLVPPVLVVVPAVSPVSPSPLPPAAIKPTPRPPRMPAAITTSNASLPQNMVQAWSVEIASSQAAGSKSRARESAGPVKPPSVTPALACVDPGSPFWDDLNAMDQKLGSPITRQQLAVGTALAVSTAFTAGYVVWMLRGGMLLTSLLAQMPAWRLLDPLVVLNRVSDSDDREEQETLETIVDSLEDRPIEPAVHEEAIA